MGETTRGQGLQVNKQIQSYQQTPISITEPEINQMHTIKSMGASLHQIFA